MITVSRQRRRAPEPRAARADPRAGGQHDRRRDPGLRETPGNPGRRLSGRRAGQHAPTPRGLANELQVPIPEGVKVSVPDQQHIVIQGIDKQKVGHFAASVRRMRKPEPYKGKGIRYLGEPVRRKQGKAMVK